MEQNHVERFISGSTCPTFLLSFWTRKRERVLLRSWFVNFCLPQMNCFYHFRCVTFLQIPRTKKHVSHETFSLTKETFLVAFYSSLAWEAFEIRAGIFHYDDVDLCSFSDWLLNTWENWKPSNNQSESSVELHHQKEARVKRRSWNSL